ncbi:conserved hypothetical protein, partial [Ricinus communis]
KTHFLMQEENYTLGFKHQILNDHQVTRKEQLLQLCNPFQKQPLNISRILPNSESHEERLLQLPLETDYLGNSETYQTEPIPYDSSRYTQDQHELLEQKYQHLNYT